MKAFISTFTLSGKLVPSFEIKEILKSLTVSGEPFAKVTLAGKATKRLPLLSGSVGTVPAMYLTSVVPELVVAALIGRAAILAATIPAQASATIFCVFFIINLSIF